MKKRKKAIELMKLIVAGQEQVAAWEAELDSILEGRPKSDKKRPAESKDAKRGEAGNGRGDLTNALRHALPKMSGEFTSRDLISAAGLPEDKVNSGFAAVSRLAAKGDEIKKSTTPGKFRRVS